MCKLSEYVEVISGFPFKSEFFTDDKTQIPLVKGENLQPKYIDWNKSKYWSSLDYDMYEKYHLKENDVLIAMDRPWVPDGLKWAYIKKDDPKSLLVQRVSRLRTKNSNILDQVYLRYIISSKNFEMYIEPIVTGVNVPHISGKQIGDFKINLPDIITQKKIAAILSAYDDLIENNKQRIKLLENMAEELYKEWFVRFRFPNWQNTEFEKGVPKGWKGVRFDSLCRFKKGANPDQVLDSLDEDMAMYINMESLTGEGRSYAKKQKNSVECQRGDLLMLMDGSRSGLVFKTNNSGIVGSTLSIIQVDDNKRNYVFEYLKAARNEIVSNNTGSAIPHANKDYINRMIIFVPNDESIIFKFNQLYCGKYALIENLQQQIKQLEKTKNSLLPRLISGKLSVQQLNIHYPPSMQ